MKSLAPMSRVVRATASGSWTTSLSVSRSRAKRGSRRSGSGGAAGSPTAARPCGAAGTAAWGAGRAARPAARRTSVRACSTSTPTMPASSRAKASTLDLSRMRRDEPRRLTDGVDPAVGPVEVVLGDDVLEHEAVERAAAGDQLADGRVALLDAQVAGVEAGRLDRDVGLGHEVLVAAEGPQRGLLPGGVAVEGEDHLAAELLVVVEEAAQHARVVVTERRTAGGDGGRDAGQVAGHHVGVALDHDRLHRAGDVAAGQVDAVEHLALLVDRGLGGVEVLRLDPVVVEDPPRPEADRLAAGLADRPEQAAAEAVVRRPADRDQPGRDGLLLGEALLPQVAQQRVAVARREADPELLGRRPGRSRAPRGTGAPRRRRAWPSASA